MNAEGVEQVHAKEQRDWLVLDHSNELERKRRVRTIDCIASNETNEAKRSENDCVVRPRREPDVPPVTNGASDPNPNPKLQWDGVIDIKRTWNASSIYFDTVGIPTNSRVKIIGKGGLYF